MKLFNLFVKQPAKTCPLVSKLKETLQSTQLIIATLQVINDADAAALQTFKTNVQALGE